MNDYTTDNKLTKALLSNTPILCVALLVLVVVTSLFPRTKLIQSDERWYAVQ